MIYSGHLEMPWLLATVTSAINLIFFGVIVYFNLYYLFPKYLKEKNLWIHIGLLLAGAIILTPIKTLSLFYASSGNTRLQSFYIQNQLYIFLSTFFVALSSTIYQIMTEWVKQQRDKKELENKTLQSELNFLKSQINPHFLFNTLNSLYALSLKKSDKAPEMVLRLAEMMRYMLYECNEKEVLLQKELTYLENYLEMEKIRHGQKVDIQYQVSGKIEKQRISPLLFIPFLENAFKHGISQQLEPGFINLTLTIDENRLQMELVNSKSSQGPRANASNSGGIGLINVKRRMEILYPTQHTIVIHETPNTYTVNLQLTLHQHEVLHTPVANTAKTKRMLYSQSSLILFLIQECI
ncbi:MAG: histidine kinase [Saprospiraceae bacterium]|nr:histidine kinase [Saprospiraceae bacterium]